MRGDFVEQQDRCAAGAVGDQLGMGEDNAQQQRLLLPGRAELRRLPFAEVRDGQILTVRPGQRAPGRSIARTACSQCLCEVGYRLDRKSVV